MERGSIIKYLLIGLAIILVWNFGQSWFSPSVQSRHVWAVNDTTAPVERAAERSCEIDGPRFKARLSTHGASLRSFVLTDARFNRLDTGQPLDLVTTTRETRSPLRTDLRDVGAPNDVQQVGYDDLDWKLAASDGKSCTFTYDDAKTSLVKTISATAAPYELAVDVEVKNLSDAPKKHRFTIEQTSWRKHSEMETSFAKAPPEFATEIVAASKGTVERWTYDSFRPDEFEKDRKKQPSEREITSEDWRRAPGEGLFASVDVAYFTNIVLPQQGSGQVMAEGQVEAFWDTARYGEMSDGLTKDPHASYVYRARLAWPERELAPQATASYRVTSFIGPKDRELLAALHPEAPEVLKLGWGAPTSLVKALMWYLHRLYSVLGSWGWAIIVMTITVRLALFPLSISQIKNGAAMRRLKPEMDEINAKYKDDAAQRGLAIQELWRKNNISNPVVGCLPMLLTMPVWFALYSALQTAVELYHVPFGPPSWVIPDLVAPGKYFIIPLVLGASSYFQQKLMPAQGDPQQQKMMLYMMPAIFTFMMLFLPAGLGVYMLTSSLFAMVQQVLVERYLQRHAPQQIGVREMPSGDGKPPPSLGKGKGRARG